MDPVLIAGYIALFVAVGAAFLFVNLLLGWLLRPAAPNTEKLEVYECGEPTIGSSFVQFDLRFYVVALLFIIFDVEVALFFPWATVFGKATQLSDPTLVTVVETADGASVSPAADGLLKELGFRDAVPPADGLPADRATPAAQAAAMRSDIARTGRQLAGTALLDMAGFFAVLLVGFAYVWHRGDLDWVRAVSAQRGSTATNPKSVAASGAGVAAGSRPILTS
jgi:NADH-quinone oxidoreductase subunit A